ncbi:hypothetical protein T484DRAFT_1963955 [Baffinella frigidus]|nr:hypothetical protein T484DRAFT_1963955 [Cryptophyta sp. CCMP2293]
MQVDAAAAQPSKVCSAPARERERAPCRESCCAPCTEPQPPPCSAADPSLSARVPRIHPVLAGLASRASNGGKQMAHERIEYSYAATPGY